VTTTPRPHKDASGSILFLTVQSANEQLEAIIPGSDVLTMSTIFWGIKRCSPLKVSTDVSDEHIAFIFRVKESAEPMLSTEYTALRPTTQ
jgi:hypothetical protein